MCVKRWLAAILVMTLCLGMAAVGAAADTTTQKLYVRFLDYDGDKWYLNSDNRIQSQGAMGIGNSGFVVFYSDETGNNMVPVSQLQCSGEAVSLTAAADYGSITLDDGLNDYAVEISAKSFGTAVVSYTNVSKRYAFNVTVKLPDVGFYSATTASEENYLESITGEIGSKQTAYLVWDSDLAPISDAVVSLWPDSGSALNEIKLNDSRLADYGISLAREENYIKMEATIDSGMTLHLSVITKYGGFSSGSIRIENLYTAKLTHWNEIGVGRPVLTYDGVEYTFGLGRVAHSGEFELFWENGRFGNTAMDADSAYSMDIALGAMVNAETSQEAAAPSPVNTAITVTEVKVVDYINTDNLTDQTACNLTLSKLDNRNALGMPQIRFETEEGGFVEALVLVSFTVQFPNQAPIQCRTSQMFTFSYTQELDLDLSKADTTEKLNEILSSKESLEAWMKKNDSTNYQAYKAYQSISNNEQSINLNLPAVTYDGLVEVGLYGENFSFHLVGTSEEGKQTTIPGMWIKDGGRCSIRNIRFVANEKVKQTYQEETFTCGVFSWYESNQFAHGDVYGINNCSFTGFDYGVRSTNKGYACAQFANSFKNCKVGYLLDCGGKTGGSANAVTGNSTFENCGTAIEIRSLPNYISAYKYRIYECNFIGNGTDIKSGLSARLYCYRNYFGAYSGENILARPSRTVGNVIANPRYLYPVYTYNLDALVLSLDSEAKTEILNKEAGSLTMDADALGKEVANADGTVSINVLDEDEQVQAVWTFGEE